MKRTSHHRRGTIIAYFLILLSVITTGLITTLAYTSGTQTQLASVTLRRDQAYYAAEAGIQHAFRRILNNNNWRATSTPLTGTLGSATYSVTASGPWNSPVNLTAVGLVNPGTANAASITVTATVTPGSVVPSIALGGNFDNAGNVTISDPNGGSSDVQTKGFINTHGRFNLGGSLYAVGSISQTGSVNIAGTANPNYDPTKINVPTIDIPSIAGTGGNTVTWADGSTHSVQVINVTNGNGNKPTDISSVFLGNGGIVYFRGGDINFKGSVSIVGSGTIVVDNNVSISNAATFGTSGTPASVNLVAGGTLDIKGNLTINGSIYSKGAISKSGGITVNGIILGGSNLDTNGGMVLNRAQPPAFDPRANTSGTGTVALTNVTGPIF